MALCSLLVIGLLIGGVELFHVAIPESELDGVGIHKELALPKVAESSANPQKCDSSKMPVMDEFDMKKFSGSWYELAKTPSGYIDTNDSMWNIVFSDDSSENHKFLFSGRDNNDRCIRPISGMIRSSDANPGVLTLKYRTYSTHVTENIRVLFTDYVSIAVMYACAHTNSASNTCHPAGLFGSIWTRKAHVDAMVFENAAKFLQRACIDRSTLKVRSIKGPCRIEDLGNRDDSYPIPNFCYHDPDPGTCQATFKRFYFDYRQKACREFVYSGCGGNDNNFMLQRECENQCIGSSIIPSCEKEAPCALSCPPCCNEDENGCIKCSCSSVIVDPPFIDHCLSKPDECPAECKPEVIREDCYRCICEGTIDIDLDHKEPDSVCLEVKDRGQCGNLFKRFYYNALSGSCEKFNYTGCGGNQNNFVTFADCETKCKGTKNGAQATSTVAPRPEDSSWVVPVVVSVVVILVATIIIVIVVVMVMRRLPERRNSKALRKRSAKT